MNSPLGVNFTSSYFGKYLPTKLLSDAILVIAHTYLWGNTNVYHFVRNPRLFVGEISVLSSISELFLTIFSPILGQKWPKVFNFFPRGFFIVEHFYDQILIPQARAHLFLEFAPNESSELKFRLSTTYESIYWLGGSLESVLKSSNFDLKDRPYAIVI